MIGGGYGSETGSWPGAVDHVFVWDRLLTTEDTTATRTDRSEVWENATRPIVPEGVWHLDDADGTTAVDASDHGLDATLHGDPETVWNGEPNWGTWEPSASLDGSEYLSTRGPAVRTDTGFTVSAWVRLDDTDRDAVAVSQSGRHTDGFALGYDASERKWFFETAREDAQDASVSRVTSRYTISTDTWVHLAGVYDHTAGGLALYIDGYLEGEGEHVASWNASGPLLIGAGNGADGVRGHWPGGLGVVQAHQGVAHGSEDIGMIFAGFPPNH
ncbi:LamG domain-containing protein [Nocardiopsis flavescens]